MHDGPDTEVDDLSDDDMLVIPAAEPVYERAPHPSGSAPDGWASNQWEAYKLFHATDLKNAEVAERCAVSAWTVGQWKSKWRKGFGPQFEFTSPETARLLERYEPPRNEGLSSEEVEISQLLNLVSAKARRIQIAWLDEIINAGEKRIKELTVADVKGLSAIAKDAEAVLAGLRKADAEASAALPSGKSSIHASLEVQTGDPAEAATLVQGLRAALTSFSQGDETPPPREAIDIP